MAAVATAAALSAPPPPYPHLTPPPPEEALPAPVPEEPTGRAPSLDTTENSSPPPSGWLRLCRERGGTSTRDRGTSQAFPLRLVAGQLQYWPFSTSDLYNWRTYNPSFSQDPQALTRLIESVWLLIIPLGMIVNSSYRCSLPQRKSSVFFLKLRKTSQELMAGQPNYRMR